MPKGAVHPNTQRLNGPRGRAIRYCSSLSSEIGQRATQHHNVIEAAKKAGVKWIVYTSLLPCRHFPTQTSRRTSNDRGRETASASPFTLLRNGLVHRDCTGSIAGPLAGARLLAALARENSVGRRARLCGKRRSRTLLAKGTLARLMSWLVMTPSPSDSRPNLTQNRRTIPYKNCRSGTMPRALAGFGLRRLIAKPIAGWECRGVAGCALDNERQSSRSDRTTTYAACTNLCGWLRSK